MPEPIRLRVFGDYALFSRPELKVVRYSYDVMTPSAARGILDAIYYHPGLRWCVKRIIVERPIRFTNIRRNEVSKKILATDLFAAANGSEKPIFIDRRDAIAQRAATVLRDVSYVIEANFDVIPEKWARRTARTNSTLSSATARGAEGVSLNHFSDVKNFLLLLSY